MKLVLLLVLIPILPLVIIGIFLIPDKQSKFNNYVASSDFYIYSLFRNLFYSKHNRVHDKNKRYRMDIK